MNIVCFGEALIDFKSTGPLAFQGYAGGSPLNVAVAASRLGAEVGFATQLSRDLFGRHLRDYMKENDIDTSLVLESNAPSTLAFVAEAGGEAHFTFMANGAADTLYDPKPRPRLPESVRFVEFGSISLLREPASAAIVETIEAHKGRCAVVFDPNVRPVLIPDRARYEVSLKGWLEKSHIVKVSAQDLRWLYPGRPFDEIAQAWLGFGSEVVIVTQGERGVGLYRHEWDALEVSVPQVNVADTVGAGDTFTGALMVALLERGHTLDFHRVPEASWREVLGFAAAAAALNCTQAGAQPPRREALEAFLKERGYG